MILNNLDISTDTDVKFNFSSLIDSKPVKEISFNTLAYPQQIEIPPTTKNRRESFLRRFRYHKDRILFLTVHRMQNIAIFVQHVKFQFFV